MHKITKLNIGTPIDVTDPFTRLGNRQNINHIRQAKTRSGE